MISFLGEYEATLDSKGRFLLPAGLKRQIPEGESTRFVINRGFEKCLTLYPMQSWQPLYDQISTLNDFDPKVREFMRQREIRIVVRGLRAVSDFEFEFQLATMSRHLSDQVDYVFMTPTEQFNFISSTLVREIASLGGDVSQFVHPSVRTALTRAWEKRRADEGDRG